MKNPSCGNKVLLILELHYMGQKKKAAFWIHFLAKLLLVLKESLGFTYVEIFWASSHRNGERR